MVEPPAAQVGYPGSGGRRIHPLPSPGLSQIGGWWMDYQWMGPSNDIDTPLSCFDAVISTDTTRSSVQLRGQLDVTTAPRLEQILDQLRRDGYRHITLDLSGLEFLGACVLSVFIRVDQALRAAGGRLILTRPPPIVRRVLSITGLDTALTIR